MTVEITAAKERHFPPSLVAMSAIVVAFSTIIAAALAILEPGLGGFPTMMVFSLSIGLSIFALHLALQWLRIPPAPLNALFLTLRALIATPLGYVIGNKVALTLLGLPQESLGALLSARFDIIATVVTTVVILYIIWSRQRMQSQAYARSRAEQLATEAQLRLLRTQIEPHMLFNTLANLRSLMVSDPERAQVMIDQLIIYLRATLGASRIETTTLKEEFAQLRAYLEIMAVRMGSRLHYDLQLPDALESVPVPAMILQPLVENAIKHGLEPKVGAGSVSVLAVREDGKLQLIVRDTGVGALGADVDGGYGLTHVRERLAARYGTRARLQVDDHGREGFSVSILLPVES